MSFIVAIDGPASSGKGTVTKKIARKLNIKYIDSGILYRCVALKAIEQGVDEEVEKIAKISEHLEVEIENEEEKDIVFFEGREVTTEIRKEEINKRVGFVATIQPVRKNIVRKLKEMASENDIIMEGRDIGTVIFPNADVKIYLDADVEVRAKRRYKEHRQKGIEIEYEEVLKNLKERDESDLTKGGLRKAQDAIEVNTDDMSIEEVTDKIIEIIKSKMQKENKNEGIF